MKLLRAIDFIEARLTDELSLPLVARAAGLSSYHFSRMFRALTGETVTGYIRRRRLTEAARRLLHRDDRVIELAVTYGFDSQAAFSRAFKRQFGVPPGAYRRNGRARQWAYRPAITADDLHLEETVRDMEPRIIDKPGFKAVGLAGEFNQSNNDRIPDLWRAFRPRYAEIASPVGDHSFGLCIGMEDDNFIYAAAVEVENLDAVPDGLSGYDIAPQTYAVFTVPITGKAPIGQELGRANRYIWQTWLPASGHSFARAPDFEYYDDRFSPDTMRGEIDIYVPICKA